MPIPEVKQDAVSEPVTPASLAALQSDVQPVGHDYVEEVLIGENHCSEIGQKTKMCHSIASTIYM